MRSGNRRGSPSCATKQVYLVRSWTPCGSEARIPESACRRLVADEALEGVVAAGPSPTRAPRRTRHARTRLASNRPRPTSAGNLDAQARGSVRIPRHVRPVTCQQQAVSVRRSVRATVRRVVQIA